MTSDGLVQDLSIPGTDVNSSCGGHQRHWKHPGTHHRGPKVSERADFLDGDRLAVLTSGSGRILEGTV